MTISLVMPTSGGSIVVDYLTTGSEIRGSNPSQRFSAPVANVLKLFCSKAYKFSPLAKTFAPGKLFQPNLTNTGF
jgi:hypothetical protein